jgi:hypothetical protein
VDEFRRIEVITSVGRRRRWTDEEKARIVAESLDPATTSSAVARRHGLQVGVAAEPVVAGGLAQSLDLLAGEELARAELLVLAPRRGSVPLTMVGALLRLAVKPWLVAAERSPAALRSARPLAGEELARAQLLVLAPWRRKCPH